MPIVSAQNYILSVLDGLPMPNGNYRLDAYITPPDPLVEYDNPAAFIWPTDGAENRNGAQGGSIPRNTGVNTEAGTKPIVHVIDIYMVWFGQGDDKDADTWFPGMVDAVMWALRTSADPAVVSDPYTQINSQLIDVGEVMSYKIGVRATTDEAYNRYDALITCRVTEILHA
jgi:hypothetical protein